MNYYISVQGGTGLNISLASFLTFVKPNHPEDKYFVTSPYYDIFEACSAVDGVYKPNEMRDFIFDAIHTKNSKIINTRLYDLDKFIRKELNYSEAWALLMGYKDFNDTPEGTSVKSVLEPYKVYPQLKSQVETIQKVIKEKGFKNYAIMQFTGGQSPLTQAPNGDWSKVPYDYQNEPLKRHYPIDKAQKFVELYHNANPDTAIILYQLPNEPKPEAPYIFTNVMPYLAYYELAKSAKEVVTIDSSLQHLVAGVCPTTVIWGHTINANKKKILKNNFGYSYNKNIVQPCRRDDILYFTALGSSWAKVQYIEPEELLRLVSIDSSVPTNYIYSDVEDCYVEIVD